LDEAHNLSFSSDGPIDKLVREARKFGLGLILASQQPTDFNRTVFGNTASKLIFQTFDHGNRLSHQLASKCLAQTNPEQLAGDIARLQKGEAVFFANNEIFRVEIAPLRKRALKLSSE
jgi:DNA phosphorothioation-dependent restriction protein DptH